MVTHAEIQAYVWERGIAAQEEIARRFKVSEAMVSMMAERLEAKGRLERCTMAPPPCNCGCGGCKSAPKAAWRKPGA